MKRNNLKVMAKSIRQAIIAVLVTAFVLTMFTATSIPVNAAARNDKNKKGVLLESTIAGNTDILHELGVTQITYNLPLSLLTEGGGYPYKYKGVTYEFNRGTIGGYDSLIGKMNKAGISVTLIILNDWHGGDATLVHPLSRDFAGANYYAFNTAEQAGMDKLEAVAQFLAERYSGQMGVVDNWIIGNEVNARQEWNYMTPSAGINTCAQEYAKALRLFYSVMTSHNPQARVYACIDHEWSASDNAALHYGGKAFLNAMQTYITQTGNFDYGIAIHPYNVPLYKADTWNAGRYATHKANSPYVTTANLDVLTDYISQPAFLAPNGSVRSVICSEVSFNSIPYGGCYSDGAVQSAAAAYAYLAAENNQHVDGIFLREMDSAVEVASSGIAGGLIGADGTKKPAYAAYAGIDNPKTRGSIIQTMNATAGRDLTKTIVAR